MDRISLIDQNDGKRNHMVVREDCQAEGKEFTGQSTVAFFISNFSVNAPTIYANGDR